MEDVADNYMYQDFYAVDIRKKLAARYGLTPDHILIGSGSSAVIDMLGEVFINYGDEIVYCSPSYEAFPDMVSDNGGVRVEVPLTKDYKFDLDGMLAAVTDKTKMVIVVNPNNPHRHLCPLGRGGRLSCASCPPMSWLWWTRRTANMWTSRDTTASSIWSERATTSR